ncbi:MAG: hypothetical protein JST00_30760 [Deltaproteobacteria bacterium]|nr:hypothetical protein [Deltaproteobacteria bacterium]
MSIDIPRLGRSRARLFVAAVTIAGVVSVTALAQAAPDRLFRPNAVDDALVDGEIDAEDLVARAGAGRGVAPLARGGGAWISLLGYSKQASARGEREVGGMVVVGLPLERIVRHASSRADAAPGPYLWVKGASVAPGSPAGGGEGASEGAIALSPRVARSAVAAAWRAAGLSVDDSHLDGIVSRARWSAVLPEARLRAVRFDDERLYTDASAEATKLKDSAGANLGLEARLTWRLDRLLYADDEPAFERMRLERHDARSRIAGRVLEALFHWQRASLELRWAQNAAREAREPLRTRDEVEAALRVMEAEATLDVLTAGWFSSTKPQRRDPGPAVGPPESL